MVVVQHFIGARMQLKMMLYVQFKLIIIIIIIIVVYHPLSMLRTGWTEKKINFKLYMFLILRVNTHIFSKFT